MLPSTKDQVIECTEKMEWALEKLSLSRDIWQNEVIWWIAKSVHLLLTIALKRDKSL